MFSPLRNRFGIPGVISVIALVFAMLGGAYAASNDSGSGDATASAKGKKGPRGPRGKTGKTGSQGPVGPQGPAGPKGDNGTNGSNGADGSDGTDGLDGDDGKSVVVGSFTTEDEELGEPEDEPCKLNGGDEVEVEDSGVVTFICNGSPWAVGGTLPEGATETGGWNIKMAAGSGETSLSFPIPLAAALAETSVKPNSLAAGTGTLSTTPGEEKIIKALTRPAQTPPWVVGTPISGTGIPAGTQIAQVLSATEIEISQNATAPGVTVPLSSSVWPQCDDGNPGTAATPEHPEADSGFLCVFVAKSTGAAMPALATFKSGTPALSQGASTAGVRMTGFSTTATDTVAGTFAVTG